MSSFRYLASWGGILLLMGVLSGCWEEKSSYFYLMSHPDYLQMSYNRCVEGIIDSTRPCSRIRQAHADFVALIQEREQNPEGFGARILQEQENAIYLKAQFSAAQQAYYAIDRSKSSADLQKQRLELDKKKSDYQASGEQVKILLSVISATSSI